MRCPMARELGVCQLFFPQRQVLSGMDLGISLETLTAWRETLA